MARPAPATERTVAVLNFLAARPDEAFTLSELCRRLGLNKATAHAMVAALTDAGYLLRHPVDRTYTLGPALVAVGNAAAARRFEVVDYARDEMRAVAEQLDVQCVAAAALGDEMVMLATSGSASPFGAAVRVGDRVPLVPPLGTVYMAWSAPTDLESWLRRLGPTATEDELEGYRAAVAAVRARGYSVALEPEARLRLARALRDHDDVDAVVQDLGHEEYNLLELDRTTTYPVSVMTAPVFDADGHVALTLNLVGFRAPLRGADVPAVGERLRDAGLRVTRTIHGRVPDAA
jgi:DNA-binding IclR family transcriptional regulator